MATPNMAASNKPRPETNRNTPSSMMGADNEREANYAERQAPQRGESYHEKLKWNNELRRLTRGIRRGAPLPKGVLAMLSKATAEHPDLPFCVWLLPIMREIQETSQLPRGKQHVEVDYFPKTRKIMLKFDAEDITVGVGANGRVRPKPVPISLDISTGTCVGRHITNNYTPEDAFRGVLLDSNWTKEYMIWPMSAEDVDRVMGLLENADVQAEIARRSAIKAESIGRNNSGSGSLGGGLGGDNLSESLEGLGRQAESV